MTDIVERLNDSLSAGYSELRKEAAEEIMRLRAKIEQMERQEPIDLRFPSALRKMWASYEIQHWIEEQCPLYALPGAQPAPSVPGGWLRHAARMAALARKLREPDWHFESIREMQRELCALEEAALAAAPEAKP